MNVVITDWHFGRAWTGHRIEDECPCSQAPCGLIDGDNYADECVHHNPLAAKTLRQGHRSEDCPAAGVSS